MGHTVFETLHKSKLLSSIAMDRLGDYFELLRIEMKIQGRSLGAQLLGYAIAVVLTLLTAVFFGVAVILTFWESPYRAAAAWGVVALYGLLAWICYAVGRKAAPSGSAFTTLRNELHSDVQTVKESM
jgi:uncharacterized membrane protein YqjE